MQILGMHMGAMKSSGNLPPAEFDGANEFGGGTVVREHGSLGYFWLSPLSTRRGSAEQG